MYPYIKINLKCLIDLNIRDKITKHLEESTEKISVNFWLGRDFLGHKNHNPSRKFDKLDYIKVITLWVISIIYNSYFNKSELKKKHLL